MRLVVRSDHRLYAVATSDHRLYAVVTSDHRAGCREVRHVGPLVLHPHLSRNVTERTVYHTVVCDR